MAKKTKEERFKEVASRRTEAVLRSLRSLSKCSNTKHYTYTDKQITTIFRAINSDLRNCKNLFNNSKKNKGGFEL